MHRDPVCLKLGPSGSFFKYFGVSVSLDNTDHWTGCYGALVSENCLLKTDQAKNHAQLH